MGRQARIKAARRLVPAAMKALADTGLPDRVRAVREAVRSPFFDVAFRAGVAKLHRAGALAGTVDGLVGDLDKVRVLALQVLVSDFGCDVSGVHLSFDPPAGGKIGIHVRPEVAKVVAVAVAMQRTERERAEIDARPRTWRSSSTTAGAHAEC